MNQTIKLLKDAKQEITTLRRRNELLSAKVEVMELFACVLHTPPAQHGQVMCVDIAWELEKEAARLEAMSAQVPCRHASVTVTENGGGRCDDCGTDLKYDPETRNWA